MAFKFKLEKLLEIRKNERDQKFKAWSIENKKLRLVLQEQEDVNKELIENKKKYSESYKNKDVQAVELFRLYISTFKFKIADVQTRINKQKEVIENYRLDLYESTLKFKTIEKLKETKKDEYLKIEHKKNEKFIDELNVMRHKKGK